MHKVKVISQIIREKIIIFIDPHQVSLAIMVIKAINFL